MGDDKDLTLPHSDQQLAADLKAGKVSAEEVARIWDLTSDLSAQVPINVRRAMIAIRAAETPEQKVHLAMQFMMSAATEIQAAMTRDESKFAHLVAGTEAIVKTLQNVNPLAHRLERLEALMDGLGELVEQRLPQHQAQRPPNIGVMYCCLVCKRDLLGDRCPKCNPLNLQECGAPTRDADESEEAIPDPDSEPNAARAESIGSAWAQPPYQGRLYVYECPNDECGYIYLSGFLYLTDLTPMSFRCPVHKLRLHCAGEAQPEDRANFARQILKHT